LRPRAWKARSADRTRWPGALEFASPSVDLPSLLEGAVYPSAFLPPDHVVERPTVLPLPIAEGAVLAGIGFWLWRRSRRAVR